MADNTFTQVRVKCMECNLHFTVHTWYPERHTGTTLYCPECGQHEQHFITWLAEVEGYIFQYVPGDNDKMDTMHGYPVGDPIDLGKGDNLKIVWGEESFIKEEEFLTENEEEEED